MAPSGVTFMLSLTYYAYARVSSFSPSFSAASAAFLAASSAAAYSAFLLSSLIAKRSCSLLCSFAFRSSLLTKGIVFPNPSIAGFFHRYFDFKHNRISETLSLEDKLMSLGKSPLIFMGEI